MPVSFGGQTSLFIAIGMSPAKDFKISAEPVAEMSIEALIQRRDDSWQVSFEYAIDARRYRATI
ncbi:hypothetical protein ACSMXN_05460 [Jatrophihabitans sp. DSM 45814]